jgi:hypothetical protein
MQMEDYAYDSLNHPVSPHLFLNRFLEYIKPGAGLTLSNIGNHIKKYDIF